MVGEGYLSEQKVIRTGQCTTVTCAARPRGNRTTANEACVTNHAKSNLHVEAGLWPMAPGP